MNQIRALPWNGYNVVSTFSGCGGSCLGFRMAGYRVLWSSEFVQAARDTYRANSDTPVDGRDIRDVTPEEILAATGLKVGELDVLEGSPPCASFSTAGQRSRSWNKVKTYSDTTQRSDDLFFEFARILRGLQPKTFVAENVSGLVKGVAKGYFLEILSALKSCGYRVRAKLLDAQWLGVPQMRQRIIFVGVREDLAAQPAHPEPLPYRYSVRDALEFTDLSRVVGIEGANGFNGHAYGGVDTPAMTVQASRTLSVEAETHLGHYAIGTEWDKLEPGETSQRYFNLVRTDPDKPCQTVTGTGAEHGGKASVTHPTERRKFSIAELRRICGFPDDFVLTGTYPQQWERLGRAVPPVMMRAVAETVRDRILTPCLTN